MALIEREALKATLKRVKWLSAADGSAAVHLVNVAPTIDAAPVVYGRWIWNPEYCKWICSECGGREGECEAPICKWCGARMDGGEGHESN